MASLLEELIEERKRIEESTRRRFDVTDKALRPGGVGLPWGQPAIDGSGRSSIGGGMLGGVYVGSTFNASILERDLVYVQSLLDHATRRTSIPAGPVDLQSTDTPPVPAPDLPSAAYRERLKRIGATALMNKLDAEEETQRFQALVIERGLRFYNKANVEAYLRADALKSGIRNPMVTWVPLASYSLPIPEPVLETIEVIHGQHPAAQFFISTVVNYPDPFLMVKLHGNEFIPEKWDEPGYRESE